MKTNLFLGNFFEDKISQFNRLKIVADEILYKAIYVMNIFFIKLIGVGCQFGIAFGVFFDEKEELVFYFECNFGIVGQLVYHSDDQLKGSGASTIDIDVDSFDEVIRICDGSIYGFAVLEDLLNFG
jgi:hypothetical protein